MPVTARDAQALTYLAMRIRQDTRGAGPWDEHGTHAVVSKLVGQSLSISIERIMRHAADPGAKTPGAITRPFVPPAPSGPGAHPPRVAETCPSHPAYHRDNCGGCRADELAGDEPLKPAKPANPVTRTAAIEAARAGVRGS